MKQLTKHLRLFLHTFALSLLLVSHGFAQDEGLSVEQLMKVKSVSDVALSADGNHLAYTVRHPKDPKTKNETSDEHLYVYNTNEDTKTPFYTRGDVNSVHFRPDYGTITFTARPEGAKVYGLYEISLDGGEAQKLYEFDRSIRSYDWASNGNKLVFTASEAKEKKDHKLPYQPNIYEEGLTHSKGYVVNLNSDEPQPEALQVDGTVYIVKWGPEDERIAFSEAPTPLVDDYYMKQSVKVADAGSKKVIANIDNEGKLADIQWSPDGDRLALLAGNDIHDVIAGRIMVVDADGGTPENIKPDFEGKFEQIDWTGSNRIHFIASESAERGFGRIKPDGSGMKYKIEPGNMVLSSFSYVNNNNVAFSANKATHPDEVYLKSGLSGPKRITNLNPWLEDVAMGDQSVVSYEARDGEWNIEGVLIKPLGFEEGDEVPTIVAVHGGPEAHYSNGWVTHYSLPGQVAAGKGYAVFYPNYRGSTGRGIEFLKSSQGDAGGAEFDDIVDGVDYLVDEGVTDKDRVGVTGGSYGGYATGWMSTYYSDRFAAGVMNVGISNNISKWGTSDIPEEMYLVHARERLWEDNWMKYLKRSPIYHVDKAETPLMIANGEEDTRVHPGQSLELYRHIKVRKPEVPLRLVTYPNEGHGYRKASAQYDYALRMFRWFDQYLHGGMDQELPDMHIDSEIED